MERAPVTRRVLARELVVSAATRPTNVVVGVAVLVAAFVLQAWWLVPVAFAIYLGMVGATLFDGDRAERVGRKTYEKAKAHEEARVWPSIALPALSPAVTEKLALAHAQEERIRKAIADAPASMSDLGDEIDRLMKALDNLAARADTVHGYLQGEDAQAIRERIARLRAVDSDDSAVGAMNEQAAAALQDQLTAIEQLERQLARFDAQMEHIAATLGVIHAQIVRMSVEEEAAAQGRVAEQVRDLRREVGAAADAMQEAYVELG
jgi:type IV secretory pathway TrbD component